MVTFLWTKLILRKWNELVCGGSEKLIDFPEGGEENVALLEIHKIQLNVRNFSY